ncbi:MAG: WD40 repeat domain-containing protein [Planctomycetes bacterium]|nr:WD40 repeat domain-containing protein [Planctomycetota bacterium]
MAVLRNQQFGETFPCLMMLALALWVSLGIKPAWGDEGPPAAVPAIPVAAEKAQSAAPLPKHAVARLGSTAGGSPLLGVYGLVFSPDGRRLATRSADQIVRVWDVAGGRELAKIDGHKDRVLGMAFSPDGNLLATSSEGDDPAIRCWDPATGKLVHAIAGGARLISFTPDGKAIQAVDRTSIFSYPLAGEKQLLRRLGSGTALAMSSDGGAVAVSDSLSRTRIKLYRSADRPSLQSLRGHLSPPISGAFSPNSTWFAICADRSQEATVWNLQPVAAAAAAVPSTLSGHTAPVQALAFSPDSRHLATASWDKTVRIWELSTRQQVAVLEGHRDQVCSVAFSADGRQLASGAAGEGDTTTIVWNVPAAMFTSKEKLESFAPAEQTKILSLLSAEDPAVAYAVIGSMIAAPKVAIALVGKRLQGENATAGEEEIRRLLKQLDHDEFRIREEAHRRLLELRTEADTLLREALVNSPSAEVRHRVEKILKKPTGSSNRITDAERRWMTRAVLALEQIGTPEAQQQLKLIAAGPAHEPHVQDAVGALKRLGKS